MTPQKHPVGHPPKPHKRVNFRISSHSLTLLEQYAQHYGISKTEVLEKKMTRYLNERRESWKYIRVNLKSTPEADRKNLDVKLDVTVAKKLDEYCKEHFPLTKTSFLEQLIERSCVLKTECAE